VANAIRSLFAIRDHHPWDTANTVHAMHKHLAIIEALENRNADLAVGGPDRHVRGLFTRRWIVGMTEFDEEGQLGDGLSAKLVIHRL
jgi:hypothetical protein